MRTVEARHSISPPRSAQLTIGISEMQVSGDINKTLVTYSLGSCLGVAMWDPQRKIGGMVHCLLPLSRSDKEKAKAIPAMFVDTGVAALIDEMGALGAQLEDLVVKVAGGASPLSSLSSANIGERNLAVLRKILWKNNLLIESEDVGDTKPRTLRLNIGTGQTTVNSGREVTSL